MCCKSIPHSKMVQSSVIPCCLVVSEYSWLSPRRQTGSIPGMRNNFKSDKIKYSTFSVPTNSPDYRTRDLQIFSLTLSQLSYFGWCRQFQVTSYVSDYSKLNLKHFYTFVKFIYNSLHAKLVSSSWYSPSQATKIDSHLKMHGVFNVFWRSQVLRTRRVL